MDGSPVEYCPLCMKYEIFKKVGYEIYHPEVKKFHDSQARVKICWAPSRTTKSYSAAHDMIPSCLLPNTMNWIIGNSYSLSEKEFRVIHDKLVINRAKLGIDAPLNCSTSLKSGLYIKFPWGAIVEGKSADRPESLLGEAVDTALYAEAAQMSRVIRERYVMQRVITKRGTELIPTTPFQSARWVYELCQMGQLQKYKGEIESFHWDVRANPFYPIEEFNRARDLYGEDDPMFREQYLGEWVFYGGSVYPTFRGDVHVIEPFDIPKSWNIIRGIDYGGSDPFVCLWCAIGKHGELYFFHEYYNDKPTSIREHAAYIKQYSHGMKITQTVADPSNKQLGLELQIDGIPISLANNDRMAGRLRVMDYLLQTDDAKPPFPYIGQGDIYKRHKHPRIYFFKTMENTLKEFTQYRFKEKSNQKHVEGMKESTEGDDHAMDVMRYIVMTRPSPFVEKFKIPYDSFNYWMHKVKEEKLKGMYKMRKF